jgi:hypothetical protein
MIVVRANPLLNRAWGISPAEDRVWAQVCGIAPGTRPWERVFVVLQGFIDDSYTKGGVFVLAGYISTVEAWAEFSKEWELLLPSTFRGHSGKYRFKMSEMARRMDRVVPFYRVIENHVAMSLYCKMDISQFERAKQRIWVNGLAIDWGPFDDPYRWVWEVMLGLFHTRLANKLFSEELSKILNNNQIDFYSDDHSAKRSILNGWENFYRKPRTRHQRCIWRDSSF